MTGLTILHAPLFAGAGPRKLNRAIDLAVSTAADSIGFTEAYSLINRLRHVSGYRLTVGNVLDHRAAGDTPILTRKEHLSLGTVALKASDLVPRSKKVAPERWHTGSMFVSQVGEVAHVALHPNAAVQDRNGRPRTKTVRFAEYRRSMLKLDALLWSLERLGFDQVVVTGDVNWRQVPDDWQHSPYRVLQAHQFQVFGRGLDVLAVKGLRSTSSRVLERSETGMDHPWLLHELEALR